MGAREGRDLVGVIRVNTSNNERPRKDEVTLPKSLQPREAEKSVGKHGWTDGPVSGLARSSSDGISKHISTLCAHDWPKNGARFHPELQRGQ